MAIGPGEKVTTTGMMDVRPTTPQAPDLSALGQGGQPTPQPKAAPMPAPKTGDDLRSQFPEASDLEIQFAERAKSLTDEDMATLQSVLSPSVRTALGKIIPEFKEVMDAYGSNEPNVVIPLSMASNFAMIKYGGASVEEAIQNFTSDLLASSEQQVQPMEQQTTVPPSQPMAQQPQGLMASPQNMEQV